ncbi:hypothetical protein EYF80_028671 [Liparis tanakae]|uniref:Uncharacterized protein n=1 Tax=Liparis tanakae TaxID=230148 RepID=A0A4Z2H811_9TELE|nr:hypothetical protein EYF80_028671 [Liparis tanakae]
MPSKATSIQQAVLGPPRPSEAAPSSFSSNGLLDPGRLTTLNHSDTQKLNSLVCRARDALDCLVARSSLSLYMKRDSNRLERDLCACAKRMQMFKLSMLLLLLSVCPSGAACPLKTYSKASGESSRLKSSGVSLYRELGTDPKPSSSEPSER